MMLALFCLLFISPIFCSQAPSASALAKEFTLIRSTKISERDLVKHLDLGEFLERRAQNRDFKPEICAQKYVDADHALQRNVGEKIEQGCSILLNAILTGVIRSSAERAIIRQPISTLDSADAEDKKILRNRMYSLFPVALSYFSKRLNNKPNFTVSFNESEIPEEYKKCDNSVFYEDDYILSYLKDQHPELGIKENKLLFQELD